MRPHRTDGVSLSFGVIFLAVALWWAISAVTTVRLPAVGWLVAGGLIMFGVLGLLGALRRGRRESISPAEPASPELPHDLAPAEHASIVRELLDDPTLRIAVDQPNPAAQPPHRG